MHYVFYVTSSKIVRFNITTYIYNRVSNLIGKGFSCREKRCRIEAGLIRLYMKCYDLDYFHIYKIYDLYLM